MAMTDIKNYLFDDRTCSTTEEISDVLNTAADSIGDGHNLQMFIRVNSAFTSEDNAVDFFLEDSADNSNWDEAMSFATNVQDLASIREVFRGGLPAGLRQYVRLRVTFATTPTGAGDISAWVGM